MHQPIAGDDRRFVNAELAPVVVGNASAGLLDRLKYLKHGLVAILAVVGAKMVLGWAFSPPAWVTLLVVAVVLGVAAAASVRTPEPERSADDADRP